MGIRLWEMTFEFKYIRKIESEVENNNQGV